MAVTDRRGAGRDPPVARPAPGRRGPRRFPSPEELPDARSAISRRARRRARSGGGVMDVVVVESPAKARTIGSWLGKGYRVIATRGHVRDLPSKAGSVKPDEDFAMVYETGKRAARTLGAVARALEKAEALVLATDPDREGEAIAWQVLSWLEERDAIGGRPVRRVVFHEITPAAVHAALAQPRGIDMDLVRAWQARRALDYLVGYGLSPVLWRKLPRCRSAGRVQSVALRLVCEREAGIEAFVDREDGAGAALPVLAEGEPVTVTAARAVRHVTGPPPRYTEAGLVRRLEELGIGRPSTWAAIVAVLQQRDYAILHDRRFVPTERGRIATAFLEAFFGRWVEYGFTAAMEADLDRVAGGALAWRGMLAGFWDGFHAALEDAGGLERATVLAAVEARLDGFLFGAAPVSPDPVSPDPVSPDRRRCPVCGSGELELIYGRPLLMQANLRTVRCMRSGAYIYPAC